MQLYLNYRVIEDLKFDEAQIFHGKSHAVVVRLGIAQCCKKCRTVLQYPLTRSCCQHSQAFHVSLAALIHQYKNNFSTITDFSDWNLIEI